MMPKIQINESDDFLVTIVTVCYADPDGLEKTLLSIEKGMDGVSIDHIVVAKGIEKSKMTILQRQFSSIGTRYILDRDKSLYDAMNIGLSEAKGTHILFLNAGDCLYDETSLACIEHNLNFDRISQFRILQYHNSIGYVRPGLDSKMQSYSHQGFVAPVTEQTPMYDTSRSIDADTFWKQHCVRIFEADNYPDVVASFELGGISNRPCVRSIKLRFSSQGTLRASAEIVKFIIFHIVGAERYYRILANRKGYDQCALD